MKKYEYGRVAVLADKLKAAQIDPAIAAQIMEGGETISGRTPPERRAAWMKGAMQRMDKLLDPQTRHAVREACACCLGGVRRKLVQAIDKRGGTFEERVQALNDTKRVVGHSAALQDDGSVLVQFFADGQESYRCVCLSKAQEAISETYCYCCGGHIKHHAQVALGRKLRVKVRSSALSSGGKLPCSFVLTPTE